MSGNLFGNEWLKMSVPLHSFSFIIAAVGMNDNRTDKGMCQRQKAKLMRKKKNLGMVINYYFLNKKGKLKKTEIWDDFMF